MQNDVMMFKRRHLVLISIKLLKVPENYVPPEVIKNQGVKNFTLVARMQKMALWRAEVV